MARKLDKITVIDLESTCWRSDDPDRQDQGEIIEIGACILDPMTLARSENHGYLVIPENSKVNTFCTKLTGHTQGKLERDGKPLVFQLAALKSFYPIKERAWASYGDYDRRQFERECTVKDLKYPFGATHINVKNLFALAMGLPQEVGMAEALQLIGLPLQGRHHNGADDAWNIAAILGFIVNRFRDSLRMFGEAERER